MEGATCGLTLIGQPIIPAVLGFVVSKNAPCVLGSMSFAIKQMLISGEIAQIEKKWFMKPACSLHGGSEASSEDLLTLTVADMAGVFMLTGADCVLAFLIKLGMIAVPRATSTADPSTEDPIMQELAEVKGLI